MSNKHVITSPTFKTRVQTRTNALNVAKHFTITHRWAIIILLDRFSRRLESFFEGVEGRWVAELASLTGGGQPRVISLASGLYLNGNNVPDVEIRGCSRAARFSAKFSVIILLNRYRYFVRELSPFHLYIFSTIVDFIYNRKRRFLLFFFIRNITSHE